MPTWYFAHVQDDLILRILRMFEIIFSLDAIDLLAVRKTLSISHIRDIESSTKRYMRTVTSQIALQVSVVKAAFCVCKYIYMRCTKSLKGMIRLRVLTLIWNLNTYCKQDPFHLQRLVSNTSIVRKKSLTCLRREQEACKNSVNPD